MVKYVFVCLSSFQVSCVLSFLLSCLLLCSVQSVSCPCLFPFLSVWILYFLSDFVSALVYRPCVQLSFFSCFVSTSSCVFNLSIQLFPFLLPLTPVFRSFVSVKFTCLCLYLSGYASCFILVANLSCVLCLLFLPLSCYS